MHDMKKVLMTGGTGFVGVNLVRRLLSEGCEVHLLVSPQHKPWRITPILDDLQLHNATLEDSEDVERVVKQVRPDWVFHLAAHGGYSWQTDQFRMIRTNILGTVNLVEACLETGCQAFINTGSSSEYGFKDHAPCEDEVLAPNSYYAVTKAASTLYCRYIARSRDFPLTTLRLYSVYGPYEDPTRLMPALVVHGLRGGLPPLVNPDTARDFVHVDDTSEAFLLAARAEAKERGIIYNVGTGVQTTLRELVDLTRRVFRLSVEPEWGVMSARLWDTNSWVADSRAIRERLGWRPSRTLEDGFRATAAWFRANPELIKYYEAAVVQ